MGVAKKTRKFAQVKRVLGRRDERLKKPSAQTKPNAQTKSSGKGPAKKTDESEVVRHIPQVPSGLFFQSNQQLGPPYHVILDTNFFSHSVLRKVDIQDGLMDLLLAKSIPVVTDCTIAELEKLGNKYRLALRLAKDERWKRLRCSHSGTYADQCIVDTVMQNRCYLVGTDDKELRQRLRKIPGVPLVGVGRGKFHIERLPEIAV
ncbi:unnamed protein product [Clonostachys byssicola]|uniref:PIN domain-containing protein n=1 Tax=Clonostachys byssicola TaxID=160290 RepID=A0A9N9XUJ3_9HYPO|nr:unnamed protein product [Clonostachys byssicola]